MRPGEEVGIGFRLPDFRRNCPIDRPIFRAAMKTFFAHQSVGADILAGIEQLARETKGQDEKQLKLFG